MTDEAKDHVPDDMELATMVAAFDDTRLAAVLGKRRHTRHVIAVLSELVTVLSDPDLRDRAITFSYSEKGNLRRVVFDSRVFDAEDWGMLTDSMLDTLGDIRCMYEVRARTVGA